jgi:hypothetical protein
VRPIRPLSAFSVARPFYGSLETHAPHAPAAVAPPALDVAASVARRAAGALLAPAAAGALGGAAALRPGRVAGRAVLEPPGWSEAVLSRTAALPGLQQAPQTRLRIFSGTSNPVRGGRLPQGHGWAALSAGRGAAAAGAGRHCVAAAAGRPRTTAAGPPRAAARAAR